MSIICYRKSWDFGQQRRSLDSENRRVEHLTETSMRPNDFCERLMDLVSLNVSIGRSLH